MAGVVNFVLDHNYTGVKGELEGGITKVVLNGRMDIQGAAAIDLKMNVVAGTAKKLLIDMQQVEFIGSMGLRSLVLPAQAVSRRGGKVVLFAPVKMVERSLALVRREAS